MWKETMSSAGKIAKAMHLASALLNWILQLSMQDSVYVMALFYEVHYLRAQSQGHHTVDRLEERGVERGSARRSSLKGRERAFVNQTNIGTVLKSDSGEASERRGWCAYGHFRAYRYHLELNWTAEARTLWDGEKGEGEFCGGWGRGWRERDGCWRAGEQWGGGGGGGGGPNENGEKGRRERM